MCFLDLFLLCVYDSFSLILSAAARVVKLDL